MNEAATPEYHLLRMISEGHQPQRQELRQAEYLLDRGLVDNWTTDRWLVTALGREALGDQAPGAPAPPDTSPSTTPSCPPVPVPRSSVHESGSRTSAPG